MKYTIDEIIIPSKRKRFIARGKVKELAESIKEIGLLQPIIVTINKVLISGLHRLEACKLLDWQEVDCVEKDYSELDAELAEIDENLIRAELTTLERGEHLLRRKEIYEAKHPEAKKGQYGHKGNKVVTKAESEIISFSEDTAAKLGVSSRTVQQEVQIAEKLAEDVKEAIRGTPLEDNKSDLLELARLEPEKQKKAVEKILKGEAKKAREAKRKVVAEEITKTEELKGKYRVIYADPPWQYGNNMPDYFTEQRDYYPTMTIEELCNIPIKEIAAENAVLFLWVTSPILEDAFKVIGAWGFKYKASFVWDKVKHNMGHYNSVRHEFLLVATRGSCMPDTPKLFDSVVSVERTAHSEKPEIFREIIDTLYPHGKRIELFARKHVEGWDVYGNQLPDVPGRQAEDAI